MRRMVTFAHFRKLANCDHACQVLCYLVLIPLWDTLSGRGIPGFMGYSEKFYSEKITAVSA
jgi:hypothetical protein